MQVDILYFDGCPNQRPTVELVRDVVQSLGLTAIVREVEVRDVDEASAAEVPGVSDRAGERPGCRPGGQRMSRLLLQLPRVRPFGLAAAPLVERALQDEVSCKKGTGDST